MYKLALLVAVLIVLSGCTQPGPTTQAQDTDGDGIEDSLEVKLGTDPQKADTDGDGFPDFTEIRSRSNPLSADSYPGKQSGNIPDTEEINLDTSSSAYVIGEEGDQKEFTLNQETHSVEFVKIDPTGITVKARSQEIEVFVQNNKAVEIVLAGYKLSLFGIVSGNTAELFITNLGKVGTVDSGTDTNNFPNYIEPRVSFENLEGAILFGYTQLKIDVENPEYVRSVTFEYFDGFEWTGIARLENKHLYADPFVYWDTTQVPSNEYQLRAVVEDVKDNLIEQEIAILINQPPKAEAKVEAPGEGVLFFSVDIEDEDTNSLVYEWEIDSQKYSGETASVSYSGNRALFATLTVTNALGLRSLSFLPITGLLAGVPSVDQNCTPKSVRINILGETEFDYFIQLLDGEKVIGIGIDKLPLGLDKSDPDSVAYGIEIVSEIKGNPKKCTSKQLARGTRTVTGDITREKVDEEGNIIESEELKNQEFDINPNDFPESPSIDGDCPYTKEDLCSDDYQIEQDQRSTLMGKDKNVIYWYDQPKNPYGEKNLKWNDHFLSYVKGTDGKYCWIEWELIGEYDEKRRPVKELKYTYVNDGCSDSLPYGLTG